MVCQTVASFGAVESSWNIKRWSRGASELGSLIFYLDKVLASLRHLAKLDCMKARLTGVLGTCGKLIIVVQGTQIEWDGAGACHRARFPPSGG